MDQVVRNTKTQNTIVETNTAKKVVTIVFWIIEALLAFRLVFKLFEANASNIFVRAIYALTGFFTYIFEGIFSRSGSASSEAIATLIAMLVVALIAFIILKLIRPKTGITVENAEQTQNNRVNDNFNRTNDNTGVNRDNSFVNRVEPYLETRETYAPPAPPAQPIQQNPNDLQGG